MHCVVAQCVGLYYCCIHVIALKELKFKSHSHINTMYIVFSVIAIIILGNVTRILRITF